MNSFHSGENDENWLAARNIPLPLHTTSLTAKAAPGK